MRLKMLVGLAGGLNLNPGDEHDFADEAEAIRHIEAGHAVPLAPKKIEKAVKPAPDETR